MNRNKKVVARMTVTSAVLVMTTITALGGSTEDGKGNVTGSVTPGKKGMAGVIAELQDAEVPSYNAQAEGTKNKQNGTVSLGGGEIENAGISAGVAKLAGLAAEEVIRSAEENGQEYIVAESLPVREDGQETEVAEVQNPADVQEVAAVEDNADTKDIVAQDTASADEIADIQESTQVDAQAGATGGLEAAAAVLADAGTADVEVKAADMQETAGEEQQEAKPESNTAWTNKVMANVEEDMNIRTSPDADAELAGKFYRGDVAEVISVEGEWTKISSGNATGYVKNEYLVYGDEANQLANEVCSLYATVNTDGLRLRSEPHEEAGIVTTAADGDRLKVNKEAEGTDGWVAVYTTDSTAYVSAEYVNVELNLGTALNSEEVAAKEAQEAEAERAAEDSAKKPAASANSDEVTLLGALIQCEAGGGSYDGMVAVGAVVMNRVRSGSYPGSISGVIYQGGQFTPALNGSVASVMASGVRSSCLQAARDAIGGTDNTNGALSFRSASSGHAGTVIGANVFF